MKGQSEIDWRYEMLDRNDKQWITEVLDEKLSNTKTELHGEMQEMKTELRGEMQEMEGRLRGEMQEMEGRLRGEMQEMEGRLHGEMQEMEGRLHGEMQEMENNITDKVVEKISDSVLEILAAQANALLENTYQKYMKLIGENVPDKIRSYDRIDEKQQKHQDEIEMLRSIAYSHENRIARLEKVAY